MHEQRIYRERMHAGGLVSFQVAVKETDLYISACTKLKKEAESAVRRYRKDLEDFIVKQPMFESTLTPYEVPDTAPDIVKTMAEAARKASVGPMAAVAGAIAEYVGNDLLCFSEQVIVENGGDLFIHTLRPRKIAIYAGRSPLSNKIGLEISPDQSPLGICTSAGTIGHSLSFGSADAVVVVSKNTAFADAKATAIGNKIHKVEDIERALELASATKDTIGIIIIKDDQLGAWGKVRLTPL